LKFFEEEYVKNVKKANKKGLTYLPELYKDTYDSATGEIKRQKLPRPLSPEVFHQRGIERISVNTFRRLYIIILAKLCL
jgi:hypothetical protein